jgi:hypothetical protein
MYDGREGHTGGQQRYLIEQKQAAIRAYDSKLALLAYAVLMVLVWVN